MNNEDEVKQEQAQEPENEESGGAPVLKKGTTGFAHSPEMDKIAEALAKAQGEIQAAVRDAKNPYHKSTYADLCSVWEACREPLSKNGLAVLQPTELGPKGTVDVITMITHSGSGQWIRGRLRAIPGRKEKDTGKFVISVDPQSVGSAITYMRRYGLAAMVGVAPQGEDDDGERAMGRNGNNKKQASTRSGSQKKSNAQSGSQKKSSGKPDLSLDGKQKIQRLEQYVMAVADGKPKQAVAFVRSVTNDNYSYLSDMPEEHLNRFWDKVKKNVLEFEEATKNKEQPAEAAA